MHHGGNETLYGRNASVLILIERILSLWTLEYPVIGEKGVGWFSPSFDATCTVAIEPAMPLGFKTRIQ